MGSFHARRYNLQFDCHGSLHNHNYSGDCGRKSGRQLAIYSADSGRSALGRSNLLLKSSESIHVIV